MRAFHVMAEAFQELAALPQELPARGFVWVGCTRSDFEHAQEELQIHLLRWTGTTLVDLHVSDLLNAQLPSHYDYTSGYDLMVFRRLATHPAAPSDAGPISAGDIARQLLESIDTSAVGFAVFDRVLLTVHPAEGGVLEHFALRLGEPQAFAESRGASRRPSSPADLMLRIVNHMVDSYLELRRVLTRQLSELQRELLDRKSRFTDWQVLLDSRNALHLLQDTCEDQHSAVQEWLDALEEWPDEPDAGRRRERELLRVRARDVLEHIERVLAHVGRLQQSAEVAVQIHFSALGNRTNDIMRTLTALTAVFLPLNLITGFFGMNFDGLPLIHSDTGVWIAAAMMVVVSVALGGYFWRRRYMVSPARRR